MITGRQSVLPAGGRATVKSDRRRGDLRWVPVGVAVGALLAWTIGTTPAAMAADPSPVTIASGVSDVDYAIDGGASGSAAVVASPHPGWIGNIPSTSWINTTGLITCDQACDKNTTYSSTFTVPSASVASVVVNVLADNVATVRLNDTVIGTQTAPGPLSNFQVVDTFSNAHVALPSGVNTLSIDVLDDSGVANGLRFSATINYVASSLALDFTANDRGYNGTNVAAIADCTVVSEVLPGDDVTCSHAAATATFDTRNAGEDKVVTGSGFALSGEDASFYSVGAVDTGVADIAKAPLTVTAVPNVKVANFASTSTTTGTEAAAIPTVSGTVYTGTGDVAAFSEKYDTAAAGSNKTLTPSGTVSDGNAGDNYAYTFVAQNVGQIRPAPVASVAFTTQPIDTQVNTSSISSPIYSTCVPPASGSSPCATAPTSTPIKVTAKDAFGNLAGPGSPGADGTTAAVNVTIKETGFSTLATVPTLAGIASFDNLLKINSTRASTTLGASASPTILATSSAFQVVSDLAACDGTTCGNLATGGAASTPQKSLGRIRTTGDFFVPSTGQNVILTTAFSAFQTGTCATPSKSVGETSEVRVQGTGVTPTSPEFSVTLVYPKDTIKKLGLTSRSAEHYDVCLGATWLGTGTPSASQIWKAMNLKTGALQPAVQESAGSKVYWGWVPMCSALSPGQYTQNPCIILKTKQVATLKAELVTKQGMSIADFNALGAKDADIMLVVRKPWPWDGKFGTGLK